MKTFLNYIADGYRQYEREYSDMAFYATEVGKRQVPVNEADSKYIVEKNPNDGKWYVMGHVGQNKWMPVSSGFKNKAKAQKWAKSQSKVDVAARGEVGGV